MERALSASAEIAAAHAACAGLIRTGSRSFYAASRLLPAHIRQPAYAIYAFCRISDDAVDGESLTRAQRRAAIRDLRRRLDDAYAGRPAAAPCDIAFADVARRSDMPKALPAALIDGLAFDAEERICETLSDLYAYSARVAASVGAMMTVLMGVRDPWVLARACDLGVAMQLTNIARDVGEDARNGRVYLPSDWLAAEGVDRAAFLARPVFDARIGRLVARLLAEAERLYARSAAGIGGLPLACRPAIQAARIIYRAIGRKVAANGHDSIATRAVIGDASKLLGLAGALARTPLPRLATTDGPLPETAFLVEAAASPRAPRRLSADERIGVILDLIGKLNERDRALPPRDPTASAWGGSA
jgi:15-cis-phytoene synthase